MTTRNLLEAASLVSESAAEDGTWRVKVISEGKGSSGIYTAELLENHHHAFDEVLSFRNHPTGWDGPEARDFTMIAGEIKGKTWVDTDETGRKAVYANYLPDPEYKEKIERYKNKLGLSIYIEGSGFENDNGDFVVDWFNPEDPYASLDVVIAPGARGKFLESAKRAYESLHRDSDEPSVTAAQEERKLEMDEKDREAIAALTTAVQALVTDKQAAQVEAAQATADEKVVEERLDAYDAAVEAIEAAELPADAAKSLRAEARKGVDVAPLIEFAKAVKDGEAARIAEAADTTRDFGGRKVESATELGKVFG